MRPLLLSLFLLVAILLEARDFYVSPAGSDGNPGTREQPFRTIQHAKVSVAAWNAAHPREPENIIIWLSGGVYLLSETVVFGVGDGALPGQTITYAALPGETPVINSDVRISGWTQLKKMPRGLPKHAGGKIWVATVPESVDDCKVLFAGHGMLPRARTPAIAHIRKSDNWSGPEKYHNTIPFDKETTADLFNPLGAEISVIGAAPWTINILPVKSVDFTTGMVYLTYPSTYALAAPRYYMGPEAIWVENTFAGLDSAGKWMFDKAKRQLYYWPADDIRPGEDIFAPRLVEMIRVEGKIDYEGPMDNPVRGLIFKGLTFTHGNRFESAGKTGLGLQHDWERFDASTALLRFRGAENCAVEDCIFINSGGAGVRLDLYAQHNRIVNNEFSELGGGAILLAGYGPGTKDVNKYNLVSNNYIHHVGRLWWHALGIWIWQSGYNTVTHNTIHNVPYTAIAVTGRIGWDKKGVAECSRTVRWSETGAFSGKESWEERERFLHGRHNIISNNDIHHVMDIMQDGNGVYISGTGHGNKVIGNFVHDTPSMAAGEAIRCDDDQHETLIENNIVFKYGTHGIGIASKGRNHIINNIIACPPARVNRGMLSMETNNRLYSGSRILHNILYATGPDQPFIGGISKDITLEIDGNIYFNKYDPRAADEYLRWARERGIEKKSLQADPLFIDVENANFHLQSGSPAVQIGFRPFELNAGRTKGQ